MIKHICDWCHAEISEGEVNTVVVRSLYHPGIRVSMCPDCRIMHMPESVIATMKHAEPRSYG